MKKAALLAAALAMVLSLAACGNRDNNSNPDNPGSTVTDNNGTGTNNGSSTGNNNGTNNGAVPGNNGTGSNNGTVPGNNNGTNNGTVPDNNGTTPGSNSGSLTGNNGTGTGTGTGSTAGADNGAVSRAGGALRRAADDVGDAVTGLVDGGRSAVARGTSTTTFQRMLDNAHIHDTDGVLTDGENSRW